LFLFLLKKGMSSETKPICAIICGHTGSTGREVLALLVADPRIDKIVTIGRRPSTIESPKIEHCSIKDVSEISSVQLPPCTKDHVLHAYWTLGTTRKDAGSAERFREIDFGGAEGFVSLCRGAKVERFSLLSSTGASSSSWFLYTKTKGEIEDLIAAEPFPKTAFFRPGLLDRGSQARWNESAVLWIVSGLPVHSLAAALIQFCMHEGSEDDVKSGEERKDGISVFWNAEIEKLKDAFEKENPEVFKVHYIPPEEDKKEEQKPEDTADDKEKKEEKDEEEK